MAFFWSYFHQKIIGGSMFTRLIITTFLFFQLSHCTSLKDKPDSPLFSDLSQTFLKDYWEVHPGYASQLGLSQYDAILEVPDKAYSKKK